MGKYPQSKRRQAVHIKRGYTRQQPLIEVEYTCTICSQRTHWQQYPGRVPTVCKSREGKTDCEREANRRRVAAYRERQEQASSSAE